MNGKIKKFILDPTILVTIALVIVIFLTWIPHDAYSDSSSNSLISNSGKYGLLDAPIFIWYGFVQMFGIFLYVVSVGILFQILNKYGAIESVIIDLQKGTNGNKYIFSSLIFSFIFLMSSLIGFFEQFIILLPILWTSFNRVGISKSKTTIIFIISACFGRAFSTLSPYGYTVAFDSIIDPDVIASFGGKMNQMIGIRFLIMIIGYSISLTIVNILVYFERNNEDMNIEIINDSGSQKNRVPIYISWLIFILMTLIILMTSINWEEILGSSYASITNFINNNLQFIGATIRPIDQWGNPEKVTIILTSSIIITIVFSIFKTKTNNDEKIISTVIIKMMKVYSVFAISKSVSLVLVYSGLANSIANLIDWKSNQAIFILSIVPIVFATTFVMNSQTGALIIFTPIISQIIGNSDFANKDIVLIISMATISLCIGLNSIITPTQSINTIPIRNSEIEYKTYYKTIVIPVVIMFTLFAIIIFPIMSLI